MSPPPERYGFGGGGEGDQPTRRGTLGRIRITVTARTIRLACRYLVCLNMLQLPLFLLALPLRVVWQADSAVAQIKAVPAGPGDDTLHG